MASSLRDWNRDLGFFAHSATNADLCNWEPLVVHLEQVASMAELFAAAFRAEGWGYLAGLWHDLGKFNPAFQRRLFGNSTQVEHAGAARRGLAQS